MANLKDSGDISYINTSDVRKFTSIENSENGKFRFFRYSQDFPSEQIGRAHV